MRWKPPLQYTTRECESVMTIAASVVSATSDRRQRWSCRASSMRLLWVTSVATIMMWVTQPCLSRTGAYSASSQQCVPSLHTRSTTPENSCPVHRDCHSDSKPGLFTNSGGHRWTCCNEASCPACRCSSSWNRSLAKVSCPSRLNSASAMALSNALHRFSSCVPASEGLTAENGMQALQTDDDRKTQPREPWDTEACIDRDPGVYAANIPARKARLPCPYPA